MLVCVDCNQSLTISKEKKESLEEKQFSSETVLRTRPTTVRLKPEIGISDKYQKNEYFTKIITKYLRNLVPFESVVHKHPVLKQSLSRCFVFTCQTFQCAAFDYKSVGKTYESSHDDDCDDDDADSVDDGEADDDGEDTNLITLLLLRPTFVGSLAEVELHLKEFSCRAFLEKEQEKLKRSLFFKRRKA